MVQQETCTKQQLQSLLSVLLYIYKCAKSARYFVNRLLEVLRNANNPNRIVITGDLAWFKKYLEQYNGVSIYDYKNPDFVVQLDTCLTGMGGCWKNLIYQLPIPLGYKAMRIVHLEMINILVATKLFKNVW